MPPKPKGDRAMTGAERVRLFRERERAKNPILTDRQKLLRALQEIARLHEAAAKAAPAAKPAPPIDKERSELEFALHVARHQAKVLHDEVTKLKAKIVKPVKPPPLDPEGEAARRIENLKAKNTALRQRETKLLMQLRTLVPSAAKAKVAKALTEQSTSPEIRLDALQAWNGLGLNNIGK